MADLSTPEGLAAAGLPPLAPDAAQWPDYQAVGEALWAGGVGGGARPVRRPGRRADAVRVPRRRGPPRRRAAAAADPSAGGTTATEGAADVTDIRGAYRPAAGRCELARFLRAADNEDMRFWRREMPMGWGVHVQVWEVALVLGGCGLAVVSWAIGGVFEDVLDTVAGLTCLTLLLLAAAKVVRARLPSLRR